MSASKHLRQDESSIEAPGIAKFVSDLMNGKVPDHNNPAPGQLVDDIGLPIEVSNYQKEQQALALFGSAPTPNIPEEDKVAVCFIMPVFTADIKDLRGIFALEGVPLEKVYDLALQLDGKTYLIRDIHKFASLIDEINKEESND